jgi:hypothetical protein
MTFLKQLIPAIVLVISGAAGVARAETPDETLKTLPPAVQKTIHAESDKETILKIQTKSHGDKKGYKVVMQDAAGLQKRVMLDGDGKVVRRKQDVQLADLPPAVGKTVAAETAGTKLLRQTRVTHDGKTEWEAEAEVDAAQHHKEILLDDAGKLERVEAVIDLSAAPAAVQTEITKAVGKGKLTKVEASTLTGKPTTYEAAIDGADGKKAEITFTAEGKVLERE